MQKFSVPVTVDAPYPRILSIVDSHLFPFADKKDIICIILIVIGIGI